MQINSFPDRVMVKWEEESRTLQIKAIKGAIVSGEKVGQLNAGSRAQVSGLNIRFNLQQKSYIAA